MTSDRSDRPLSPTHAWRDALFDAVPTAVLIISRHGLIVDANQAAEQFLNQSRAALTHKSVDALIPWPHPGGFAAVEAQPGKAIWAYSLLIRQEGGVEALADIALGVAQSDPQQSDDWRVLTIHPVPRGGRTPFRKPGSAARSASAAAAMLAHEIKNPLSGIRGAAQLLGKGGPRTDAAALSNLIVGEVDRIAHLIDGMQGFTRDAPLPCRAINIYPAIDQARALAKQGFGAHVRFHEAFDPSLPHISGNLDALIQILINLIKNASEAVNNTPDPRIRLTTAYRHGLSWDAEDGQGQRPLPVEIAIADNGPGVPDAIVDSLFDPFVTGKSEGQGLGLALVDKLAREMGGFVQHERQGTWTVFRLHLPAAATRSDIDGAHE